MPDLDTYGGDTAALCTESRGNDGTHATGEVPPAEAEDLVARAGAPAEDS